jgi:hypothetical protein
VLLNYLNISNKTNPQNVFDCHHSEHSPYQFMDENKSTPKLIKLTNVVGMVLGPISGVQVQEFKKAEDRILKITHPSETLALHLTKADLMAWTVKFASLDLNKLSAGQWSDLTYELYVFITYPSAMTNLAPPDKTALRRLHRLTSDVIESIIAKKALRFSLPGLILKAFPAYDGQQWLLDSWADDYRSVFIYRLLHLLPDWGHKIRRCPGCDCLFFAKRADQRFHNLNCLSRQTMRAKRCTPPERYGKRGRPKQTVPVKNTISRKVRRHGKKRR